jgi:pilus assembly protein CpaC
MFNGLRPILLAGLLAMLVGGNPQPARAQDKARQSLELKLGVAESFRPRQPVRTAGVADPAVATASLVGPREITLVGKAVGSTTLILTDENQNRELIDLVVGLDLTGLKNQLHQIYPGQDVEVRPAPSGIVLSGTVSGPEIGEQAVLLASSYLPPTAPPHRPYSVTNLLRVGGFQQVLLEVKFAEVARRSTRDWQAALGITGQGQDLQIAAGIGGLDVSTGIPPGLNQGSLLLNFAGNQANIFAKLDDITAALKFLEEEGLARVLAEPRLVTRSGVPASFLAGGEFPIPVLQQNAGGNAVTVQFREFGVSLRFTPVVLSDGKISLQVAPAVSEIANASALNLPTGTTTGNAGNVFSIPSLTTRKLETTVELYDGQTLALAGLLQDTLRESAKKIPGLGDLPILGSLFRSANFIQNKTDLLIAVTPHLIKPNREGTLTYPGEFMQVPSRFEFYLQGRLEGARAPNDIPALSQHGFAARRLPLDQKGGLEGDFGHEPLKAGERKEP